MRSASRRTWQLAQTGHLETWAGWSGKAQAHSPQRAAVWRAILAELEARHPLRPGERVLDIGCGLDTVFDFLPGARGFTLDSLMRELRGFGLSPHARHNAGLLEALPFADGSFDRVFLMNVLDHVRSPETGLRELARVLRPGGVLVLSVDTYSGGRYVEKRVHKWWERVRGARTKHPWVFSREHVLRALRGTGFAPDVPTHVPGTKARRTLFTAAKAASAAAG